MALPTDDVLKSWNQIMRYQVDFSFPLELPVYLSMESWRSADYVLDLGSGDGYYARRLAEYFSGKSYTCIDIDDRAIEAGRMQFVASGDPLDSAEEFQIEFENADILNYKGSFPVAIARLLVQHLDAPEQLFLAAPNFLEDGGTIIVIDSNDEARLFWPENEYRRIDQFFRMFAEFQPHRRHSNTMEKIALEHGFKIQMHQTLTIPSSIPSYKESFFSSYQLFFDIVEKHYQMPFDYESLRTELDDWSRNEHSYSQIGVNACAYSRVG